MRTYSDHSRFRRLFRARLLRNRDGATAIEFAFLLPVVVLLVMGIVEFSLIMFVSAAMESATATTSRLGKTGYTANGFTRDQTIVNAIVARTAGLLNSANINITTKIYASFDSIDPEPYTDSNQNGAYTIGEPFVDINGNGTWDANPGTAGAGAAGDIVVYTIWYDWPVMTPVVNLITGNPYRITVRAVVRNEPF